jgi:hypothetical protein
MNDQKNASQRTNVFDLSPNKVAGCTVVQIRTSARRQHMQLPQFTITRVQEGQQGELSGLANVPCKRVQFCEVLLHPVILRKFKAGLPHQENSFCLNRQLDVNVVAARCEFTCGTNTLSES